MRFGRWLATPSKTTCRQVCAYMRETPGRGKAAQRWRLAAPKRARGEMDESRRVGWRRAHGVNSIASCRFQHVGTCGSRYVEHTLAAFLFAGLGERDCRDWSLCAGRSGGVSFVGGLAGG